MAIGFRSETEGETLTPGATVTLTLPSGVVTGDVLVAILGSSKDGVGGTCGWTAPVGWTRIGANVVQDNAFGRSAIDVFWALGNVASLTFTKSGTVGYFGYVCVAYTGVDNTTANDAAGTGNGNTGATSLTTNEVTVVTNQAWHIIGVATWNSGTFSATGFTVEQTPGSTAQCAGQLYNTTPKEVGSTGTVSVSSTASGTNQIFVAQPFALRPAITSIMMGGDEGGVFYQLSRRW